MLVALALEGVASSQITQRVSVRSDDGQAIGGGDLAVPSGPIVSSNGRYIVFHSGSHDIIPNDTNATGDVFVRDRQLGTTERVSVSSAGGEGNAWSGLFGTCMSEDGRYVAFESIASNLVSGDANGAGDIFLRDRLMRTTERVSLSSSGTQGNGHCLHPWMSEDARYIAFSSAASTLVAGDANGVSDVFIRDQLTGITERVSVNLNSIEGNGASWGPAVSADGRIVAYYSSATNLVQADTNAIEDVFVRDRASGTTARASVATGGAQANGESLSQGISNDGRYVVFVSLASNLVAGDTNNTYDIFVHDLVAGSTERVSIGVGGVQGNLHSVMGFLSGNGRFVAFQSASNNLVPGDTAFLDIFVRDLALATTARVSVTASGAQANNYSEVPSISQDGRFVAFRSTATNLARGDTNGNTDVFLHDRHAAGFTSLCDAGLGTVGACPCGNPPASSGRGCDNSASTGGATLTASGIAYLSADSLVFTTAGEITSAVSILIQGNAFLPNGTIYGQGIRCAGGSLKRLFVAGAVNGSISVPNFGSGDPAVSTRSASRGDLIRAGQSRWYFVYYRDPIILGGCSPYSTLNSTQTGQVTWSL